ncbi:hypothetical protein C8J57DRAFT_335655 [Mycena rebaudengoi]|nr:hypothetical protein C8J57DRAFT_335655 [Mycena rebaudengoi]
MRLDWGRSASPSIVPMLCEQSSRWRNIDLYVPSETLEEIPPMLPVPLLQRLSIGVRYRSVPQQPITAFEHSLQISHVRLVCLAPSRIILPWAQLLSFNGMYLELSEYIDGLNSAPNLLESSFALRYGRADGPSCVHQSLRTLSLDSMPGLEGTDVLHCRHLINLLTTPSLHVLKLYCTEDADFSPLAAFITRSQCSLQRLFLSMVTQRFPAVGALLTLLGTMATLTELHIEDAEAGLIAFLDRLSASPSFLPCIRKIRIERYMELAMECPYNSLLGALASRFSSSNDQRHAAAPLQSFRLEIATKLYLDPGPAVRAAMRELESD